LTRFGKGPEAAREAFVRQADALTALVPRLEARWTEPLVGAWSPAEVFEHVMKVNVGMSKTLHLLRRDAPLPEQKRVPGALREGKAQSPPFALPGAPKPWAALEPDWRETRGRFLAEIDATRDWHGRTFFHPYFGDLDALGWVQAAALHMAHHRKQLSGHA